MSKKNIIAISLAGLLLVGYFATFGLRTTRLDTVKKRVAQNVRTGESPEEVLRFLDAQHFEHSSLMRTWYMLLGGHDYGNNLPVIVAIKRNTARAVLWHESIQVVFVFDEDNKLAGYDVFPVYTGL